MKPNKEEIKILKGEDFQAKTNLGIKYFGDDEWLTIANEHIKGGKYL